MAAQTQSPNSPRDFPFLLSSIQHHQATPTQHNSYNMETLELPEVNEKTEVEKGWQIILYNDDVNTFDHVIESLVKYCKHSKMQAEQCAYIVHYNGKTDVKRGSLDDLLPIHEALIGQKLSAVIEQV